MKSLSVADNVELIPMRPLELSSWRYASGIMAAGPHEEAMEEVVVYTKQTVTIKTSGGGAIIRISFCVK